MLCYNLDGALEWEQRLGTKPGGASGGFFSFPTLKNGVMYVGSGNGNVYAVQASGELDEGNWPAFGRDHQHTGRDLQRGIEAGVSAGREELRLTVEPGKPYILQGSSDLRAWTDCTNLVSATPFVTLPRSDSYLYYRLAVP